MKPGQFISFEGPEGSGKSTNIQFVESYLRARDIACLLTREPGGTALGEKIRALLLDNSQTKMDYQTELLLMFAARAQHVSEVIKPALAAGTWVLCDRFTDASFAYQGGGRGIDSQKITELARWTLEGFAPDLTFLLDVSVEVGMERARERGTLDRFEQENIAFFQRVRQCYLSLAEQNKQRYRVVDASAALPDVQAQLGRYLDEYCKAYA